MRLVTLVCAGTVALSFSVEGAEAQTSPKDALQKGQPARRIGKPIVKPVPPPQARREVRRIERPQRLEQPQRQKVETRAPQAVPASKPPASTAAVAPPPAAAPRVVRRIGKSTNTGPTGVSGAGGRPVATNVALAKDNCAGANAATEWCKARQKYNDDRTKYAAEQAAWAKKKAEIDKQNAEIDKTNAEKARKVAEARKKNDDFEKAIEAKETARCKAEPPPCVRSLRQPHTIADVPLIRHNVVPPPPTAPIAAAILSTAPPPVTTTASPQQPVQGPSGAQPQNQPIGTATTNPTPSRPGGDRVVGIPESGRQQGSAGDNSRGSGSGRREPVGAQPTAQPAPVAAGTVRSAATQPDAPAARAPATATTGALAGTAAVASSAGRAGQPAASSTSWRHNNSEMQVVVEPQTPNALRIVYNKPRPGLAPLGINAGTVLFSGVRNGDMVTGQAVTFSKRCEPKEFAVSGRIVNGNRVVLQGRKPSRNDDCAVTGSFDETLEFELVRP